MRLGILSCDYGSDVYSPSVKCLCISCSLFYWVICFVLIASWHISLDILLLQLVYILEVLCSYRLQISLFVSSVYCLTVIFWGKKVLRLNIAEFAMIYQKFWSAIGRVPPPAVASSTLSDSPWPFDLLYKFKNPLVMFYQTNNLKTQAASGMSLNV